MGTGYLILGQELPDTNDTFPSRDAAVVEACRTGDSGDVLIATVIDGELAAVGDGCCDFFTVVDLPTCAERLGLGLHPSAINAMVGIYIDDTCGDCVTGRCHWGGQESERSERATGEGREYVHPHYGRCGCARHSASVTARRYRRDTLEATATAWCSARASGDVIVADDDQEMIICAGPLHIQGDCA